MIGEKERISLKIDINSGTIELDAPVENFEEAIAKTRELSLALELGKRRPVLDDGRGVTPALPAAKPDNPKATNANARERVRAKPSKVSPSAGRPGRLGSFEPIRDLLTEEQQKALREFVNQKAPAEQPDQVQVAMYQGEELLGRQGFSYNEIYTLMWRAGIDPLPKALDVVIQRLIQEQRVEKGENGYFLKFLGRTRVEQELPSEGAS